MKSKLTMKDWSKSLRDLSMILDASLMGNKQKRKIAMDFLRIARARKKGGFRA